MLTNASLAVQRNEASVITDQSYHRNTDVTVDTSEKLLHVSVALPE